MAYSLNDLKAAGKLDMLDVPIKGDALVGYVHGSYMDWSGHTKNFGPDYYTEQELKQTLWQADFCRQALGVEVSITDEGFMVGGKPYDYHGNNLKSVTVLSLLERLQEKLDAYYKNVENGTADREELSSLIWQKELVEGSVGKFPVNLQKDDKVTIGF